MENKFWARCVFVGCGNNKTWAITQELLIEHATRRGWIRTPDGWVCPDHVNHILATKFIMEL